MPLADLNPRERDVVRDCLRAAVEGPFFPDWEFSTLFGMTRSEVKEVLESWPDLDEGNESVTRAINNAFNNLLGYPHGLRDSWSQFIPITAEDLAKIYMKWKGRNVRNYFDGLM
jgi:hypothetical protein